MIHYKNIDNFLASYVVVIIRQKFIQILEQEVINNFTSIEHKSCDIHLVEIQMYI